MAKQSIDKALKEKQKRLASLQKKAAQLQKDIPDLETNANWQNAELNRLIGELDLNATFGEDNTLTIGYRANIEGNTTPRSLNPKAFQVLGKLEDLSIRNPRNVGREGKVFRENIGKIHHAHFDDGWDISDSYSLHFDFKTQPENTYDHLVEKLKQLARNYKRQQSKAH